MKKPVIVLFLAATMLLLCVSSLFSQMPFQRGTGQPGGGFGPPGGMMTKGEVIQIDSGFIVISTSNGGKQQLNISSRTAFVKEYATEKHQLKKGVNVMVIGQQYGQNSFSARVIRILEGKRREDTPRKQPFDSQRDIQAPIIGTVAEIEPFTVELDSGGMRTVEITETTRLIREDNIEKSDLRKGMHVRAIAPPMSGGDGKEAIKIIILSGEERAPDREGMFMAGKEQRYGSRSYGEGQMPFGKSPGMRNEEMKFPFGARDDFKATASNISAKEYIGSPFGFRDNPPQLSIYSRLNNHFTATGIKLASWEDIERRKGSYDFTRADRVISGIFSNGQNLIVELRPINRLYGTYFLEDNSSKRNEYPEKNLKEYSDFVRAFVERYDGDGIEDAPGSPVIKYYQCVHEVLPRTEKIRNFWRNNPEKYAELFKITFDAMKDACNGCKLYLVGGFSYDFERDGFYGEIFRIFQEKGYRFYDLGFDYHLWSQVYKGKQAALSSLGTDYRKHKEFADKIRGLYESFGYNDNEVEVSTLATGMLGTFERERHQAIYILKTHVLGLSLGLKKIIWTLTSDRPSAIVSIFQYTGLIHHPQNKGGYSHKKLSYYAYQLMLKKLGDCDWDNVETVMDGEGHVYAYKFRGMKTGRVVYVLWWDWFKEKSLKEKAIKFNIGSGRVVITSAVPEGKNGLKINEKPFFESKTLNADPESGEINIILKDSPVYMELES
jgi:hypothetical protein